VFALSACGGDGEGGGEDDGRADRSDRDSLSAADVSEATRSIEAARDCAAAYDAGAALIKRSLGGGAKPVPDPRDPAFEAALDDADAAMSRKLSALRCRRTGHVCEEVAKRAGIDRARLEC
jgi:hypothetical protein